MNVVFLDIDGVLNNLGSVVGLGSPSKVFDPVSVALVKKLCENGAAWIVVSSSWRTGDALELYAALKRCGAESLLPLVIGETPDLWRVKGNTRGDEIAKWIEDAHTVERYVILDDDSDMRDGQPFVQTTFEDGFRFRHYVAALRHLNPAHADCQESAIIVPLPEQGARP